MTQPFQTLLVTGGCGFIGVNFIRHVLRETSYAGRIVNLDALTYAGNPASLADLAGEAGNRYAFEKADIRNPRQIGHAAVAGAHCVTAGMAVYRDSFRSPYTDMGHEIFGRAWDATPPD